MKPSNYGPITDSGAEKLASSAVAPLVALARGYRTARPDDRKPILDGMGLAMNSVQAKQMNAAIGSRDALLMPWFSPADAAQQADLDFEGPHSSMQLRPHPANVRTNDRGKKMKYVNLYGAPTVIGPHPSTPRSWMQGSVGHTLMTEGMLKADSALTAMLLSNGLDESDLKVTRSMTVQTARRKLHDLMESVPEASRVLIIGFVGVTTWHKNPEWNSLRLDDGEVFVAFDGDTATNPAVWKQAKELFGFLSVNKKATPFLVDLSAHTMPDGDKVGIDDYLAGIGDWSDLLKCTVDALPNAPQGADDTGRFRMNETTCQMEEKSVLRTEDGDETITWGTRADLIARVVGITERREVTPEEEATGVYAEKVSALGVESDCSIEVSWKEGDETRSSTIEGPATLMATKPERWTDPRMETGISAEVLSLPGWPPTANGFLEAMKSHRRDEIRRRSAWTHMGWVPRADSPNPVFLVGTQAIGAHGEEPEAATCGVTESDLAGATNFGVDTSGDDDQIREDIREMVEVYGECWSDKRHFAIFLATALRPVVPRPNSTSALLSGASGSGKALPLDSEVATPDGWKRMGDLRTGDMLIGPDGKPTRLRGLSPIWTDEDIYELTLDDGQVIRMSGNHVARVSTRASRSRAARRVRSARNARATELRSFASQLSSGDANTITNIANAVGVSWSMLNSVVNKAGVPYDIKPVNRDAPLEHEHFGGFGIARRELDGTGHLTRLYPVPEVLLALADHLEFGLNNSEEPEVFNRPVVEMARDFQDERYAIPSFSGLQLPSKELPVQPYTLGAWLGDGTAHFANITTMDQEVISGIEQDGYEVRPIPSSTNSGRASCWHVNGIKRILRVNGLIDNKHIPADYQRASAEQRLALLQGLMDADGYVSKKGSCELSLSDERLAMDALELIRGLGIKASMTRNVSGYRNKDGEQVQCKDRFRIKFTTDLPVARLTRKADRLPSTLRGTQRWLFVTGIRKVETVPSRCVHVAHPTGLFVHDGFVVSHNTFSSAAIMAFWQQHPNRWNDKHLPGAAADTAAATEIALSKTPIWVMDDLAPASSGARKQAEAAGAVNDMIRSVFNGAGKRRATQTMGSQKTMNPRALLVVSAESAPLQDQSIMNRLIHVEVQPGFLVKDRQPTDRLQAMNRTRTVCSRITARCIQMVARQIESDGWQSVVANWSQVFEDSADRVAAHIEANVPEATTSTKRQSETVAELSLGVALFGDLVAELGMAEELGDTVQEMVDGMESVAVEGFRENQRFDLGNMFLADLRNLLSSHQAHVVAPGAPGAPVVVGGNQEQATVAAINQQLGWTLNDDVARPATPNGVTVGWLVYTRKEKRPVVLFQPSAFSTVQKLLTNRQGLNEKSVWEAVWKSKLALDPDNDGWARKQRDAGKLDYRVRLRDNGLSLEGIPVLLDVLLNTPEPGDDDHPTSR